MSMENLGSLAVFVRACDTRSFTAAGQQLGISSSAVSKAIIRLETRLGVRLFHRSTRSITLTPEGALFLERCRRILGEVDAAEQELLDLQRAPRGTLRISLPSLGTLFMPKLAAFKRRYPDITLDIDYSDRLVAVIEEGFDAVIRSGELTDSRLMARTIGTCRRVIVGSPAYFARAGMPRHPRDLATHARLLYRFPSTGKLDSWPLGDAANANVTATPASMITNTLDPQVCFAEQGLGIAYVPEIAISRQLAQGTLVSILEDHHTARMEFRLVWPSSRQLSPKLRVFVDFIAAELFPL